MMLAPEIREFAEALMQEVRDNAIADCEVGLAPTCTSVSAKRLRRVRGENEDEFLRMLVSDAVDTTIFFLLNAIDNDEIKLCFVTREGSVVDLPREGRAELAGWFMGSGGWRAMFSKKPHVDDFADLAAGKPIPADEDDDEEDERANL